MNIMHKRQGQMALDNVYFYTETIHNFKLLLKDDTIKQILLNSLSYLVIKRIVSIYGYVIMPNHIHLIWTHLMTNGKESPAGSFAKFTAHEIKKYLQISNPLQLKEYVSTKSDRQYQFWKSDPLAVPLSTVAILEQKLDYIHQNPVSEKWKLAEKPEDYQWSSAVFYYNNFDNTGLLTHYLD